MELPIYTQSHSFTQLFTYLHTHSLTHSLAYSFHDSPANLHICLLKPNLYYPLTNFPTNPMTYSFIHSLID